MTSPGGTAWHQGGGRVRRRRCRARIRSCWEHGGGPTKEPYEPRAPHAAAYGTLWPTLLRWGVSEGGSCPCPRCSHAPAARTWRARRSPSGQPRSPSRGSGSERSHSVHRRSSRPGSFSLDEDDYLAGDLECHFDAGQSSVGSGQSSAGRGGDGGGSAGGVLLWRLVGGSLREGGSQGEGCFGDLMLGVPLPQAQALPGREEEGRRRRRRRRRRGGGCGGME